MEIGSIVDVANASSPTGAVSGECSCRENHRASKPVAWCVIDTAGTLRLTATDSFSESDVLEVAQ